jgi:hypothetical protein
MWLAEHGSANGVLRSEGQRFSADRRLLESYHSFSQFLQIMRDGKDFDHLHPPCIGAPDGTCLPAMDGDGDLLQIMPWPIYQSMTDHDLRAIYEYLSAIPCVEGPTDPTNPRHNDCN